MKRYRIIIATVLLLIIPLSMSFAQREAGTFSIGGFGGTGFPMSPDFFKDYWKMGGIGFGGEVKFNFSEMSSIGLSFTYLPFPLNVDEMMEMFEAEAPSGMELELSGMDLVAKIISANFMQYFTHPDASFGFYVTAGGGYYMLSATDLKIKISYQGQTVEETESMEDELEDKFGVNGGIGVELQFGPNFIVFAEGKYHYLFGEEEGPDGDKGNLSFITAMGGIRFLIK